MTQKYGLQDLLYFKGKVKPNHIQLELTEKDDLNDIGIIVSVFN